RLEAVQVSDDRVEQADELRLELIHRGQAGDDVGGRGDVVDRAALVGQQLPCGLEQGLHAGREARDLVEAGDRADVQVLDLGLQLAEQRDELVEQIGDLRDQFPQRDDRWLDGADVLVEEV